MARLLTCPTCQQSFSEQATEAMPFCSKRCQRVDLGHWLTEDIGIPMDAAEGDPTLADEPDRLEG